MSLTADELVDLVFEALVAPDATDAGDTVAVYRDWPFTEDQYPAIVIQPPEEDSRSFGPDGGLKFTTTVTIPIHAKVAGPAAPGDGGANAVRVQLVRLKAQIRRAVLLNRPIGDVVQQFPFVRAQQKITASGKGQIGELLLEIGFEYYENAASFCPAAEASLTQVAVHLDGANVFDPSGTYPDPPFPDAVQPAPRTSGPDGRDEGGLLINLPQ